jgi:hypothetical protein
MVLSSASVHSNNDCTSVRVPLSIMPISRWCKSFVVVISSAFTSKSVLTSERIILSSQPLFTELFSKLSSRIKIGHSSHMAIRLCRVLRNPSKGSSATTFGV